MNDIIDTRKLMVYRNFKHQKLFDDFEWLIVHADDDYFNGINAVLDNYTQYKNAVKRFINTNTVEDNDNRIVNAIISEMK